VLHIQDITAKGRLLIPNGLLHVLLPMPDLVTLSARPSLVALGFGLGVQLFRSGSSTHREAGQVEGGWSVRRACPMAGRSEDSNVRCGKGSPEGEARGRAPYIEPLWP
jgi:hypothetical protein